MSNIKYAKQGDLVYFQNILHMISSEIGNQVCLFNCDDSEFAYLDRVTMESKCEMARPEKVKQGDKVIIMTGKDHQAEYNKATVCMHNSIDVLVETEKGRKYWLDASDIYAVCKPDELPELPQEAVCQHPNKYKNVLSASLKFYYCPDCGADLGDA